MGKETTATHTQQFRIEDIRKFRLNYKQKPIVITRSSFVYFIDVKRTLNTNKRTLKQG